MLIVGIAVGVIVGAVGVYVYVVDKARKSIGRGL